jgi:uncharacterized protein with GYD domain
MPRYLWQVNYTSSGAAGLLKEGGTSRRAVVDKLVAGVGGKVEAFYYSFGEDDAYIIVELPDDAAAAAISLTVAAAGGARVKTVTLLTPEQVDEAVKKSVQYRAPGA